MKYLLILLIVLYSGCIKKKSYEPNYTLLEYNWTEDILGEIVTGFKPNEKYKTWFFIRSDYTEKGNITVLYNSDFTSSNLEEDFESLNKGVIRKGHHSDKYYYFVVFINEEKHYLTKKEEIIDFIGEIDTKEEALFLAMMEGFNIDSKRAMASSYKNTTDGYNFLLMKAEDTHLLIEYRQYIVSVCKQGIVTWKKGNIYCRGYVECEGTN